MIRVKLSVAMLVLIVGFVLVCGLWMSRALSELQRAVREEENPFVVFDRWNSVYFLLELTVARAELDEVKEDIDRLITCHDEGEQRQIRSRLDHRVERIYDGFVPSFEGVF